MYCSFLKNQKRWASNQKVSTGSQIYRKLSYVRNRISLEKSAFGISDQLGFAADFTIEKSLLTFQSFDDSWCM